MKVLAALFLFCLLAGCRDKAVPADILPKQKMEKVLWELLQADEWAFHNYQLDTTARKNAALEHYARVFQINGIDPAVFWRSYNYYSERPAMLSPVLDSVRNMATPAAPAVSDEKPRKVLSPL